MVLVEIKGVMRYYDGYMKTALDDLKEFVAKKWDGVLLYGGFEGDGKTYKCAQDMAYLDPTFDLSRVVFNVDDLARLMDTLSPGQALMYDESWKDASNMNKYASNQRRLIQILTEKRKKRLYIGIVASTFFDLNKYFVIHRARAYIHIYAKGTTRGFFELYNRERKQELYIKGKRDWNMHVTTPNFRGSYTEWLPFDSEEYETKKDNSTRVVEEEKQPAFDPAELRKEGYYVAIAFMNNHGFLRPGWNNAWAEFTGLSPTTVSHHLRDYKAVSSSKNGLVEEMLGTSIQLTNKKVGVLLEGFSNESEDNIIALPKTFKQNGVD